MASVTLANVSKSFAGNISVLSGIDLEISDGEFIVLVGPSGCGKSTLLRAIAGLEDVTGGEIRIGDRVVNDIAPRSRDIAMVFQSYALYPHMDVTRNMSFGLMLRKESEQTISARVGEASAKLGLGNLLLRLPKHLSGGQRQRVAMGRAIVRKPKVFLFDEPLSNLDAKLRAQMRTEIKALHQSLKTTSIYVTHDQVEAMTMANRIVVMNEGIIQQVGAPLDLYDRPENLFVAGFIGSPTMNFIEATIGSDGQVAVTADGTRMSLSIGRLPEGAQVTLGLRPEHVRIASDGFPAEVQVIEPLGMTTQLTVQALGTSLTVMALERVNLMPGQMISLAVMPSLIHVFHRDNGRRVE